MKKFLPWLSVGSLIAISVGMVGCSSDSSDGDSGGKGGTVGVTGGTGGTGNGGSGNVGNGGSGGSGNAGTGGTGAGGTGGSGGIPQTELGATCVTDTDCGGGEYSCLPTEQGISNGVCTKDCTSDADCGASGFCTGDSATPGVCLERCTWGEPVDAPSSGSLWPDKCHGRPDMGCLPSSDANGDIDFGNAICAPRCRNDEECGPAYCNHDSGQCQDTAPVGAPLGADCTCPDQACDDVCAFGFCLGGWDSTNNTGTTGECTSLCTIGDYNPGACGSPLTGAQTGACFILQLSYGDVQTVDPSYGDGLGACSELCDCNGGCGGTGDTCYDIDSIVGQSGLADQLFGRPGICVPNDVTGINGTPMAECSTGGTGGTGAGGASTGGTGGASTGGTGGTTGGTGGTN